MALALAQHQNGGVYNTPGPQYVVPANTAGNLMVVFAAWDTAATITSGNGVIPAGSIADDQGNWWRAIGDTGSTVPGIRIAAWICPNALSVQRWLSVCPQGYVSSFAFILAEFSGLPANYWPNIDFSVPIASYSATSLNAAATATVPDFCFSVGAFGSTFPTLGFTSAGWTSIGQTSQGGANPNGLIMGAEFGTFAAGSVPATWTASVGSQFAAINFGISQASNLPVQINPNYPRVFVEAAFGTTPGDPTVAILDSAYQDISSYAIGPAGQTSISVTGGRQYELAQPESGLCTIALNNQAGVFNPSNTNSPFYPNVLPGVPLRVSCQFNGRRYPLWSGYVERWPQDWPDFPQWGWSTMVATDSVGVASSANLPSAVQGEIVADVPYFCFPFNEQYTSSQNTVNGVVKTASECDGLTAVNIAAGNQRTATYIDGYSEPVQTGASLGFLGDSGTGMGASGFSGIDTSTVRGPGVQYGPDPMLPMIEASDAADITLEFWVNPAAETTPAQVENIQMFEILVQPYLGSNGTADLGGGIYLMGGVSYQNTAGVVNWYTQEAWSGSITSVTPITPGVLHHIVTIVSQGAVTFWIDGVNEGFTSGATYPQQLAGFAFGLSTYSYGNHQGNANFAMAYATLYAYQLAPNRIADHYQSGALGFSGDTFVQRAGRYIAWGKLNLGLAGPALSSDTFELSAAYSTAGSPLASALNNDALSSGGLWFCNANGNLVVLPRTYLYNQPSSVTFGDNVGGGEIPYLPDTGFDFDNTYLNNSVQVTLQQGPNDLAVPLVRDTASQNQYFQRGPLQQNVSGATPENAADRANWSLNKYKQPALRVRQMKVNLASHPATIAAVLQTSIADTATVNRRPLSGANYSLPVVIGKVQHEIGPGKWDVTYQMYPNVPEGTVLTADVSGSDVLGNNVLAW